MSRLRLDFMAPFRLAGAVALCGVVLAGCASPAASTRPVPVAQNHHRDGLPTLTVQMSSAEADLVMARAIAEHEMRRP
jgi:hypothetical protein